MRRLSLLISSTFLPSLGLGWWGTILRRLGRATAGLVLALSLAVTKAFSHRVLGSGQTWRRSRPGCLAQALSVCRAGALPHNFLTAATGKSPCSRHLEAMLANPPKPREHPCQIQHPMWPTLVPEPFTFEKSGGMGAGHTVNVFHWLCSSACSKLDDQLWKVWEIFLVVTVKMQTPCSLFPLSLPSLSLCFFFLCCLFPSFLFSFPLCTFFLPCWFPAFLSPFIHITEYGSPHSMNPVWDISEPLSSLCILANSGSYLTSGFKLWIGNANCWLTTP